ncbi:MAG: hypothetical protein SF162_08890 [bacterium]|nr:hypothetical protein [bacterium]
MTTLRLIARLVPAAALLLTAGFALAPRAASAQSVDPALLDVVTTAFTETAAVASLSIQSQTVTETEGLPQGFQIGQQETVSAQLARSGDDWNLTRTSTTVLTTPQGETRIASELIVVDGVTYIRFSEAPEAMADGLPTTWANAADLALGDGGAADALVSADPLGELSLPIDAAAILSLTELQSADMDGQPMRVIQVSLDPAAILESEAAALVTGAAGGLGGGMGAGGFPGGPGGEGMPALPEGVTPPQGGALPEGMTPPADGEAPEVTAEDFEMTFAVYIGANDGLIHRIYRVIAIAPSAGDQGMALSFTTTTLTNYADFNAPITISAPTLGQ